MSNLGVAPKLSGDALGAVNHRGSHLQIIAAAGSGKTEVVSQRIVSLIADGVASREIVGFTFTEKAPGCRSRAHRGRTYEGSPVARLGVSILGFPQVELLIPLGRLDSLLACMQVLDEALELGARFPSA